MTWYTVGDPERTADAGSFAVEVGGVPMVIVSGGGTWWAIEDRCSHAGCAFSTDGEIDGLVAICNCHGSEFDVPTGAVAAPPAGTPIRTFPVRVTGDTMQVKL